MFQISKRSILHDPEVGLRGLSPPLMGKKTGGVFLKFSQRYGVELSLLYRPCAPQLRLSYCHTEKGCMRGPELLESFFFFFNLFYLFIYGCVGSPFLCEGFLQLWQAGATLHRSARASHHRGLTRCGPQAPDAQAQQLWLMGPAAPRHVGSSQTRARTRVPCIGRQTLNHSATREALRVIFKALSL